MYGTTRGMENVNVRLFGNWVLYIISVVERRKTSFCGQDYFVVMLSPVELDPTMKMLMQVPLWAQRVINVQGSALKDGDLARCR